MSSAVNAEDGSTGATKVICTGHIVRRQSWKQAFEAEKDLDDMARSKGPSTANFVHVDMSYQGACDRVKNLEKDFSSDNCRWGMMNIWRPIERPVTRSALTMCDARSVRESDLVEVKAEFPKVPIAEEDKENHVPKGGKDPYSYRESFGTWHVRAPKTPDDHKWYYASEMKPEEVLLLKIYDSKMEGVARRSPHTAFESEKDWGPERQSLEVRCIVAWEDQKS